MGKLKRKKLSNCLERVLNKAEKLNEKKRKAEAIEANVERGKKNQVKNTNVRPKPSIELEDKILLIGEGNFSFASSIAENYLSGGAEGMTATCFDSEETLYQKYEEAKDNVELIREFGGTVMFDVDGTDLPKEIRKGKYTKIIFNFPHSGAGIKDQDRNVIANQKLLNGFFKASIPLLTDEGEIQITLKTCKPYNLWAVKSLAKTTGKLASKGIRPFHPEDYPGYEHRRTLGFKKGVSKDGNQEILSAKPKTYIFVKKQVMEAENENALKGKRKREDDDSEDEAKN
ncbi:hypothetical protein BY458DRAFT_515973 [Sporodiniella umbellata]|nr:hypothetical protein BY458DRAFT_515973 [Sporodiniella umbellata]